LDISELQRITEGPVRRHPWESVRARVIRFLLRRSKKHFTQLTDIGSGDAFVLNGIAASGLTDRAAAVDTAYTPALVAQLKTINQEESIHYYSSLPPGGIPGTDGFLFLDVLEHCQDPSAVIADALRTAASTTVTVAVTVPAFNSLFSQHDLLLGHYRRYSRRQLVRFCRSQGLAVKKSGYFFFSLLPLRLLQLLAEKLGWRKARKSIDNWQGGWLLTNIISAILWVDFSVCYFLSRAGLHLPGLSCYCICEKAPS